jgi:hypothetical protein
MEKPPTKKPLKIKLSDHPQFRVVHANTWAGGLSRTEADISFFTEILEPTTKDDGEMVIDTINRQRQISIRMTLPDFIRLTQWMNAHVQRLVKNGTIKKEDVAKPKQDSYTC